MMNANTTAAIAAIQEILATVTTTATTAITSINEILATVTTTETATTETTTETATTETATTAETDEATTTETVTTATPIIVLDDDDNVITTTETTTETATTETATTAETDEATTTTETTTETTTTTTETTGDLPFPIEATAPDESEIKNQISVGDLDKIADEAKEIDLPAIYAILKYALHKEGRNEERDRSPYAPDHNMMADIGHCCKIYLAEFDDEISIIVKHRDYASPLMRKTITKLGDFKEQENPALLFITGSVKAEADIRRFLDVYGYVKDLIINK